MAYAFECSAGRAVRVQSHVPARRPAERRAPARLSGAAGFAVEALEARLPAGGMAALAAAGLTLATPDSLAAAAIVAAERPVHDADPLADLFAARPQALPFLNDLPPLGDLLSAGPLAGAGSRAAVKGGGATCAADGGVSTASVPYGTPDPAVCCTQVTVSVETVGSVYEETPDALAYFRFSYGVVGCRAHPVGSVTVSFSLGGSATPGDDDYSGAITSSPVVVYPTDGQGWHGEVDVPYNAIDDLAVEDIESIIVSIEDVYAPDADAVYLGQGATYSQVFDNEPTIAVSASDAGATEGATNADGSEDSIEFTFSRASGTLKNGPTVNYALGGTASPGADYTGLSAGGSVGLPAGQRSAVVRVAAVDDPTPEAAETIQVTVAAGAGYRAANGTATATVYDNEPTVSIAASASATEGTADPSTGQPEAVVFTVRRDGPTTKPLSVKYIIAGGTATAGEDYGNSGTGTVDIPAGQASAALRIVPVDDRKVEGTETVQVAVEPGAYRVAAGAGLATASIYDNDEVVRITAIDPTAFEPSGTTGFFRLERIGATFDRGLAVNIAVEGTATEGQDYAPLMRTVSFGMGLAFADITVSPSPDNNDEDAETVVVRLLPDQPPAGSGPRYTVAEGGGQATVTIDDVWVKQVTWEGVNPGDGQNNLTEDNPEAQGGEFRLFPDKNTPTGPTHRQVWAKAILNRPVPAGETATIYIKLFDVDDPTGFVDVVDPNDDKHNPYQPVYSGNDNRGDGTDATAYSVQLTAGQDFGTKLYTSNAPYAGNNYRAFATTNAALIGDVEVDPDYQNGKSSVNGFRHVSDPANKPNTNKSSPALAIWRKLHIERDSMAVPPPNERFDGAGVGNDDVAPVQGAAHPSIALAQANFKPAFIEVTDDLSQWDTSDGIPWDHNMDESELTDAVRTGAARRDVVGDRDFWAVSLGLNDRARFVSCIVGGSRRPRPGL